MTDTPGTWTMWAHRCDNYYAHFGEREYVKLYGLDDPIVQVQLIEDPNGQYWGWIGAGNEVPEMIQPHYAPFQVQFHYGWQAEQDDGKGHVVRLAVQEITQED
jgi:hypothetical protein